MATIQESMANATKLLDAAADGSVAPAALTAEVTKLLASSLSARGFMAALATGALPTDTKIRAALVDGIKAGKDTAYELIIKNIIMSGCSAHEHEKTGRIEEARLSRAASACSLELAGLLDDKSLAILAQGALLAIAHWPKATVEHIGAPTETAWVTNWHKFLERWGYSKESLEAVKGTLASVAETP